MKSNYIKADWSDGRSERHVKILQVGRLTFCGDNDKTKLQYDITVSSDVLRLRGYAVTEMELDLLIDETAFDEF